jgi:K+/H+ antiporter YhaU regulatory subunit KhtT
MRRFPPPWTVEKIPGGLKVVDANGQSLAYVYSREDPSEAHMAKVLTEDEARRIASNMAKLPGLLGKQNAE